MQNDSIIFCRGWNPILTKINHFSKKMLFPNKILFKLFITTIEHKLKSIICMNEIRSFYYICMYMYYKIYQSFEEK